MDHSQISWKTIDTFFKDNEHILVKHHIDSYNNFFSTGIQEIFKDRNPIRFFKEIDNETQEYKYECELYLGGINCDKIYYGKPIIYDETDEDISRAHYMYPNEARLRNMTYGFTIHYDVDVKFKILIEKNDGSTGIDKFHIHEETIQLEKLYLGRFPIMVQSNMCLLKGLEPNARFYMGECKNDPGGYFIIDGKEKAIVSQEGRANNMLYVLKDVNDLYLYSAEIKSVSEDASKPIRTLAVRMIREQPSKTNRQIVVSVPQVRKPVPLFIVMRALGIISDQDIIKTCLLDMVKYENYIDMFIPSVHDAGHIFTQKSALHYISTLTKGKTLNHVMNILTNFFLPHIGERNFKAKALYLGYVVKNLLDVHLGVSQPTDRDSYKFKRIEVSGILLKNLFREYYKKQQDNIFLKIDKEYFYKHNQSSYQDLDFKNLIVANKEAFFKDRIVETGFRKAFKGDWGSEAHTKRPGVVQDLNRLSFFGFLCQMRKTNLYISADGAKVVGPRLLHSTQFGLLCPIHSPDGGNVGLHKHLSTSTHVTSGCSSLPYVNYLRNLQGSGIKLLEECSIEYLSKSTKIFVNGNWIGCTHSPLKIITIMKLHRRNNMIDIYTSIHFNIKKNEIIICSDAGRPIRPLFYLMDDKLSYEREEIIKKYNDNISWFEITRGFNGNKKENNCEIITPKQVENLQNNSSIVEYIDTQEAEGIKLAHSSLKKEEYIKNRITHFEIHPSLLLSFMANQTIFPENNPYPRNAFSCGQGKQGVSLYHSNYQIRLDKTAYVLNNGQIPLTKSRYLKYLTNEEHPYGENAIVAIMCYTGFNVEDAVIVNEGALQRGLFRTTYFNTYEAHEEIEKVAGFKIQNKFMSHKENNIIGLKPGYNYDLLDEKSGLIKEESQVDEKTILIGKAANSLTNIDTFIDSSIGPKKGQVGIIDKSFMTSGQEGKRIAKVRIRAERIPKMGDKFCSRAGQKGTIGMILREQDMPCTADGIRPDIIVNPHAMPSRMTIGHLVETLISKSAAIYGGFGDCTAFQNKGSKHKEFGKMLTEAGYHSSGNEVLYNGMTGEQLEADIYFGPTYYLRLKHMPKDKINYRAKGPRNVLTRQTVQGRANDGGLRIGEMDRDCLIGHGMSHFVNESMMVRGDQFYMAICNLSGCIAVYNEDKNIFLSPHVDGPLKFIENINSEMNIVNVSKFGRDFSIVRVPYAFKLLMQELTTMNVQMRIITEQNIDQILPLSEGKSMEKMTKLSMKEITKQVKQMQQAKISPSLIKEKTPTQEEQDTSVLQTISQEDSPEADLPSDPRKREHMKLRKTILKTDKKIQKLYQEYLTSDNPDVRYKYLHSMSQYGQHVLTDEELSEFLGENIDYSQENKNDSPEFKVGFDEGDFVYIEGEGKQLFKITGFDNEDNEYYLQNTDTGELILHPESKLKHVTPPSSPEAAYAPDSPRAEYGNMTPDYSPGITVDNDSNSDWDWELENGMDFSGPPIGYWKESDPEEYERLMKNKYGDNWNTQEAMEKEAIPGQIIDTPFSSKFAEAQLKEDMRSKTDNVEKMTNILGEVEEDDGEKIITKIVSKTNKKGLEKLSAIEEEISAEKDEENEDSKTKSISS